LKPILAPVKPEPLLLPPQKALSRIAPNVKTLKTQTTKHQQKPQKDNYLIPPHALMRLKDPKQQLALAEQIQAEGLSVHETRQRVREMLGKEFKWRLVPVCLSPETYEALQRIAPEGDVKRLIQETIQKLIQA
jgi:hypothetical protein